MPFDGKSKKCCLEELGSKCAMLHHAYWVKNEDTKKRRMEDTIEDYFKNMLLCFLTDKIEEVIYLL